MIKNIFGSAQEILVLIALGSSGGSDEPAHLHYFCHHAQSKEVDESSHQILDLAPLDSCAYML